MSKRRCTFCRLNTKCIYFPGWAMHVRSQTGLSACPHSANTTSTVCGCPSKLLPQCCWACDRCCSWCKCALTQRLLITHNGVSSVNTAKYKQGWSASKWKANIQGQQAGQSHRFCCEYSREWWLWPWGHNAPKLVSIPMRHRSNNAKPVTETQKPNKPGPPAAPKSQEHWETCRRRNCENPVIQLI